MDTPEFIDTMFARLSNIIDNKTWTPYATKAAKLEEKAMKGHGKYTARIQGKLQVLNFTFAGLTYKPEPKHYLDSREGCLMAYGIADKYGAEIKQEFSQEEIDTIFRIWQG